MIRRAMPGDEAALDAFLARHAASSMFLRGNLAARGLGESDSPFPTTYHLWPADGPIRAVLGLTRGGTVLCQLGDAPDALPYLSEALNGQTLCVITGEAAQTGALIALLGLGGALRRNAVEPLFHLALADLPHKAATLRRPVAADAELLTDWFAQYLVETGVSAQSPKVAGEARERALSAINGGSVRLLIANDRPVAMASINARAAGMVQVGGVFVPTALRNQGLGRAVTRALLAEARDPGGDEAVLFANNPAAAAAYRSIGFRQIGEYRIALLAAPGATE